MFKQNVGKLVTGTTKPGGKVVDEWYFASPINDKSAPSLRVTVSLDKTSPTSITFVARGTCLPGKPPELVSSDINELRRMVEDTLRKQHELLTGLIWEEWLQVVVRGSSDHQQFYDSSCSDLKISVSPFKYARHPITGVALYINSNGIASKLPEPKKANCYDGDEPVPGAIEKLCDVNLGRRDTEAEYSYIPATAENKAALENLMGRIQELRSKLSEFLRQDTITASLTKLTSDLPALPAML